MSSQDAGRQGEDKRSFNEFNETITPVLAVRKHVTNTAIFLPRNHDPVS